MVLGKYLSTDLFFPSQVNRTGSLHTALHHLNMAHSLDPGNANFGRLVAPLFQQAVKKAKPYDPLPHLNLAVLYQSFLHRHGKSSSRPLHGNFAQPAFLPSHSAVWQPHTSRLRSESSEALPPSDQEVQQFCLEGGRSMHRCGLPPAVFAELLPPVSPFRPSQQRWPPMLL